MQKLYFYFLLYIHLQRLNNYASETIKWQTHLPYLHHCLTTIKTQTIKKIMNNRGTQWQLLKLYVFLLAGRNIMSLEGNCCWEKDSSGCPRGFDV